jgi:creatinine amidohydrolase
MTVYNLETLFPEQIQARLDTHPILVLGFGTIEWHSYHLPLGLDGLVAGAIVERIADAADAVLAPVSYWAAGGVPYPYTLKLPASVIEPLLVALFEQFGEMGFKVIVAFTGHFGLEQTLILKRAAAEVMARSPVTILPVAGYDMTTDAGYKGDHAAVGETSLLWSLHPELIRLDAVAADVPLDGVLGADPRGAASAELGEQILEAISARTAEVALRLLNQTTQVDRAKYLDALIAAVRVLAKTTEQRRLLPKNLVPSITTPAYLAYCQAMYRGDYPAAKNFAEQKLADLSQ